MLTPSYTATATLTGLSSGSLTFGPLDSGLVLTLAPFFKGEKGDKGDAPAHEWNGSKLRFKKPDGTWGSYTELKGQNGERGPPGGDLNHVHEQAVAAATWTVNHGLGKFPSVTVVDSAGEECEGEVQHTSASQCVLTFSAAFSGRAFLN